MTQDRPNVFAFNPKPPDHKQRLNQDLASIYEKHSTDPVKDFDRAIESHRSAGRHAMADVFEDARNAYLKRRTNNVVPLKK